MGLVGDNQHDISYNLTWRDLKDPSRCASKSVRRQLGHSLLSAVKYTYKRDDRDSVFRPRRGIAFISTTQIAGLGPDSRLLRFARQVTTFTSNFHFPNRKYLFDKMYHAAGPLMLI